MPVELTAALRRADLGDPVATDAPDATDCTAELLAAGAADANAACPRTPQYNTTTQTCAGVVTAAAYTVVYAGPNITRVTLALTLATLCGPGGGVLSTTPRRLAAHRLRLVVLGTLGRW